MKMLTIAMVLMFTPLASQAEWNNHFKHNKHERGYNNSAFWQQVDHRQYNQRLRIEKGIDRGLLARGEVRKLYQEQKHLARQIRHLKNRNYLTNRDKRDVIKHLDYASERIRALKHNGRFAHKERFDHPHGRQMHTNNDNRGEYRNDLYVSSANNVASAGIHFRF